MRPVSDDNVDHADITALLDHLIEEIGDAEIPPKMLALANELQEQLDRREAQTNLKTPR